MAVAAALAVRSAVRRPSFRPQRPTAVDPQEPGIRERVGLERPGLLRLKGGPGNRLGQRSLRLACRARAGPGPYDYAEQHKDGPRREPVRT